MLSLRAKLARSPRRVSRGVLPLELSSLAVWQRFPCKRHGNLAGQCEASACVNGLSPCVSVSVPWLRPEARGQGHRISQPIAADVAEPVLPYNGVGENGADFSLSVPRFRQDNDTAKIRPVKGVRVEIF